MINRYEVPEITEVGRAQDLILGTTKVLPIHYDGVDQERRDEMSDDE